MHPVIYLKAVRFLGFTLRYAYLSDEWIVFRAHKYNGEFVVGGTTDSMQKVRMIIRKAAVYEQREISARKS